MRTLKNTIFVSIMMMAIFLYCSNQVQAAQDEDYTYTLTDGEARITKYTGAGGDVTVPNTLGGVPVTSIGDMAFQSCLSLTGISIPATVTSIGEAAFNDCRGLTNLSIPPGVTNIGDQAFGICVGLTSLTIPQGVVSIGNRAFITCTGLTNISIPESVASIGSSTFNNCTALTSIEVNANNLNYSSMDGVLMNKAGTILIACPAGLKTISVPDSVKTIGSGAFLGCTGLTSITIPEGVTSVDIQAFDYCSGLSGIKFNSATTSIYDHPGTISDTATIIGYDPSTAKVYAEKYNRVFEVINTSKALQSIAITTPADQLIYTVGEPLDITGLVVTGTYCDDSTKVESITADNITGFNSTIAATYQVLTITVGDKSTTYKVQIVAAPQDEDYTYTVTDGQAQITRYTGAGGDVSIPSRLGGAPVTSIGDCAFVDCSGLTTVSIPQGITSIGDGAFANCTGLTSINIPEGVTSIGDGAFSDCSSLTNMYIPEGVKSIGGQAFWGCTDLTSISIPEEVASIGNGAFALCTGLTSIQVDVDNLKYSSINGVLYNKAGSILLACPGGLASISIPEGVTSIGFEAFRGCIDLTTISIPEGVTSIGGFAFYGCISITSIGIPEGVASIGDAAFSGCTGLTSISVPQGVTNIGDQAFISCTGLTTIHIPQGVTSIGNGAFAYCKSLTAIQVDVNNLKYSSINGVLYNKEGSILIACPGGLATISIPQGVASIGDMAFSGCTGITTISIPQEITSIGEYAFSNCTGLTSMRFNSSTTTIDDNEYTIPYATKIIGYAPSTAKDYATKYNRTFETIGYTATPLVQIGINPDYGDSAGIYVGLEDIRDAQGNSVIDPKLAGYKIDVNYDHNQVIVFDIVDEAHLGNFTVNNVIPDKASVADVVNQGTSSYEKLFFIPLAITGSSTDTSNVTIKFTSLSDPDWNYINIPDVTLTFRRGKIANETSQHPLSIVDAVAGLQYLANIVDAGSDRGKVNVVNMASIEGPEAGATCITPSIKNVIALMQYLVNIRDPYFNVIGGGEPTPPETAGFHLTDVVYYNDVIGRGMLELEGVNGNAEEKLYSLRVDTLEAVTSSSGVKYEVDEIYSPEFQTEIDKFALSSVIPGNVKIVALDETGVQIGAAIADLETEAQDNDLIELAINNEGAITGLSFLSELTTNALKLDDNFINGYMLKSNTVVFDGSEGYTWTYNPDPEDIVVTTWGALADKGFVVVKASYYVDSDNEVEYLVIKESVATSITDYNAVVTRVLRNTDNDIVRMDVFLDGVKKTYTVNELSLSTVSKGSVIRLSVNDESGVVEDVVVTGKQGIITDVSVADRSITIDSDINANDGTYSLVENATVINSKDPNDIQIDSISDILVGDVVTISLDEEVPDTSNFVDIVNIQSGGGNPLV